MSSNPPKRSLVSGWFSRKRPRFSFPYPTPSPSPPPSRDFSAIDKTSETRMSLNVNTNPNIREERHIGSGADTTRISTITSAASASPILGQPTQQYGPTCSTPIQRRRGSSVKVRGISDAKPFDAKDMQNPLVFSQSRCNEYRSCVSRILLRPRWRIETWPRSGKMCFTTTFPIYSALLQSPILTGKSFTVYYEGQIERTSEDVVYVSVGYVAGKERNLHLPGFERGSIGINCRDGRIYVNGTMIPGIKTAPFQPRQRLGLGMTFSKKIYDANLNDSSSSASIASSAQNIGMFLTRDGKKLGTWNLQEILGQDRLTFEGFDGSRDLYPAVGTLRDVVVHVLFGRDDWEYLLLDELNFRRGARYFRSCDILRDGPCMIDLLIP
ncbi:hypothetical protein G7Y89_g15668 [Cudoniella acicularis]|uniref:SPRY domain-containing protein n=1 Tax=Cudoniella acicularis TaxID=354080 RepID=A0A8H4QHS3_9HELO|nr:hypothetical protein G7Y89_g15668 [Cudoniella acicularis]